MMFVTLNIHIVTMAMLYHVTNFNDAQPTLQQVIKCEIEKLGLQCFSGRQWLKFCYCYSYSEELITDYSPRLSRGL